MLRDKYMLKRYIIIFMAIVLVRLGMPGLIHTQGAYSRFAASGLEQLKKGDYAGAIESFRLAVKENDSEPAAHLGLGIAYYHLREDGLAERELTRAAELNPGDPTAYQMLGELAYRRDDPEDAVSYWEKALQIDPSNNNLKARLDRVRREYHTEKDFNRDVTSHFLVKYEGREKIEAGRIVLRILEDAYGEIGRALSFYPSFEIQVILYSDRQFQDVTDAPGWSAGIYDGKIRIPIAGIECETPGLRRLLYHEYTHAVVRAITRRVPTWLNEGLAQYFEGREISHAQHEALKRLAQAGSLPSLKQLEGSFMGYSGNQAVIAYTLSLSVVKYSIERYGLYRIAAVLEELGKGADTSAALERGLLVSYEELDGGWKSSLE